MNESDSGHEGVDGERDTTAVNRAASIQSRVSSILAVGLMSFLGLGMLTWYYANAITRQSRARQGAQIQATNRAQGEMPLPSLGRIDPPPPGSAVVSGSAEPNELARNSPGRQSVSGTAVSGGAPPAKTAEQLAMERQLSGTVYSPQSLVSNGETATSRQPPQRRRPGTGRTGSTTAAQRQRGGPRTDIADATAATAQGRLHRLHAGNCDRFDPAGHDYMHHGHRCLWRGWTSGAAGARHQIDRRNSRASAAGSSARVCPMG